MSAVLVLVVFLAFAMMMYRRWMPAIVAVPLMAVTMAIAAGVSVARVPDIIVTGSAALAPVFVAVMFGALLGRVTIDTGIARALVNLAAEYGGERPLILALVLSVVVAVLFTSLSGLGAIIMVGSIVLPIMMTTGVPRKTAATLFLMAFALGFIFNIVNWKFYTKFFGIAQEQMLHYALILAAIDAVALVAYAVISFRRERGYATQAVRGEEPEAPRVPAWALLTPILPIVFYYTLHLDATVAFIVAALYGVLVTRPRQAIPTLVASAIRGVEDVAPAVLLFIGIGILLAATKEPQFASALAPLLAGNWIANPVAYVVVFGILSPLALYRGPLNPFGVGIAIFTVLLGSHSVPPVVLVAAMMAVVQVQNVCDPTNTANVWVANFTGVHIDEITKRTLPFQVAVATVATLVVVLASVNLFGVRAFAAAIPPAFAQAATDGFYAQASAANAVGVGSDGDSVSRAAREAVIGALRADGLRAFVRNEDPNTTDCAAKPYAAYVRVDTSTFALTEGVDLDVGLRLEDCGGWIVSEWHDHRIVPAVTDGAASELGLEGAARLHGWAVAEPARSQSLFSRGVAVAPGDPPSYYYTLFKTVDGNMRAYVRAGGPAYRAGLRTNDVVNKLDGKFWWEYGTFQTQLRAYDGKPHSFEVARGNATIDVQLAPL